jgi:hypothetical protein
MPKLLLHLTAVTVGAMIGGGAMATDRTGESGVMIVRSITAELLALVYGAPSRAQQNDGGPSSNGTFATALDMTRYAQATHP